MPLKVYKRGSVWAYRGTVAKRRLRGSTGVSVAQPKTVAERIANKIEADELKCRLDGPEAVLTFARASILYRAAGKTPRFLTQIEDYWKDALVKDIKPGAIRQMAIALYPKASAATRNRQAIVPCQAVINFNAESELCPPVKVKRFPVVKRARPYTDLQWIRAFVAEANDHLGAMAMFMFLTGARIGQTVQVCWDHIDFKKQTAQIPTAKGRPWREAHLPRELMLMLANLKRFDGRGVFFYVTRGAAYNAWKGTCDRAGIKYISFHGTRHGFATKLLHNKVDVVTIAKRGGWANPRQVLETYGHETEDATVTDVLLSDTPLTQPSADNSSKPYKTGTT